MDASGIPMGASGIAMGASGIPVGASGIPIDASEIPRQTPGAPDRFLRYQVQHFGARRNPLGAQRKNNWSRRESEKVAIIFREDFALLKNQIGIFWEGKNVAIIFREDFALPMGRRKPRK